MHKSIAYLVIASIVTAFPAAAAPPCDFKGLAVGDYATPQQIMRHFGISKFASDEPSTNLVERRAKFDALLKRAKIVGSFNAMEERDWALGPACNARSCRIPFGVEVNAPFPIPVNLFVDTDQKGKVTVIDIFFDKLEWDTVLELVDAKYGADWDEKSFKDITTDYEKKKTELDDVTLLTHRTQGLNDRTQDRCAITLNSRDMVFLHTTPPIFRAVMEIKLVSKDF